jgi:3-hydroxyacyl-CoA dehydrogenase
MSHVDYTLQDSIAVIAFGNPPVNSLSYTVRAEIAAALDRAVADPQARAIVLYGKGGVFCAGADIREFGTADVRRAPSLWHLIAASESCEKPVVAAIEGICLGGGLELALACHYRVVAADARLGLPEVKLGLLPGAGGTQRLPRLVGVETALNMILSGEPVPASLLARSALIDCIVESDVLPKAVQFATQVAARGEPPPRTRERRLNEPNLAALCQFARNTVRATAPNYPAPLRCIDAIEAASKPLDEGLKVEATSFLELLESSQSQALRHIFFSERAAARIADVPESAPVRDIKSAAVIGAGTMGAGIAICFLNAGLPVMLLESKQEALDRGISRIAEAYESQVRKKKLMPEQRDQRMALLSPTLSYSALARADIVIEAVFEDMSVKEKVFATLDEDMKPGAILATNTSTLDVNRIAKVTRRPQDVIGTHFFSPANIMKLLEVVRGSATSKEVLATTMKLAKTLKKTAVVAGVCDGFIGNRMIAQYSQQALILLEQGASPQQIDAAAEAFGFAMGPFRMFDLAGNDIGWQIRKRRRAEHPNLEQSTVADDLCELGRFGQKTQSGWYDYKAGDRTAYASRVVEDLVAAYRAKLRIRPRDIDAPEIVDRLVYSLVNEGARILEEGIAARASDIDIVYLTGYGFPVWRGGPMFYADRIGLYEVARRMRQFAAQSSGSPAFWTPAPLLARFAATGQSFNTVDERAA